MERFAQWIKERIRCQLPASDFDPQHEENISDFCTVPSTTCLYAYETPFEGIFIEQSLTRSCFEALFGEGDHVNPFARSRQSAADQNGGVMRPNSTARLAKMNRSLIFFVKSPGIHITPHNLNSAVQWGIINTRGRIESVFQSQLDRFNGVFLHQVHGQALQWPESVKKSFQGHLLRFLANTNDELSRIRHKTVLYIPKVNLKDPEAIANNKEFVQQLESILLTWTRQIREVMSHQEKDSQMGAEQLSPLAEIQFWYNRTQDCSAIAEQLRKAEVQRIVDCLRLAKSQYLNHFENMSREIIDGSIKANDNLKFLRVLEAPCRELADANPAVIPALLPEILHRIRFIWRHSSFYNSLENLSHIMRTVSNEVIRRCRVSINLSQIFEDGDVSDAMNRLDTCIRCGNAWKEIFYTVRRVVNYNEATLWDFDETSVFAQVDAFVQLCKDLQEVCESQCQFARRSTKKGRAAAANAANAANAAAAAGGGGGTMKDEMPPFGGSRGQEIVDALLQIEDQFSRHLRRLRNVEYNILDVRHATRWYEDFAIFKNNVKDLEAMTVNCINSAFEEVTTITASVHLLHSFHILAKRAAIKANLEKRAGDVYQSFVKQVENVRLDFERNKGSPPLASNQPPMSGAALWARHLQNSLTADWSLLESRVSHMPNMREKEDALEAYDRIMSVLQDYIQKVNGEWLVEVKNFEEGMLQSKLQNNLIKRTGAPNTIKNSLFAKGKSGFLENNFDHDVLKLLHEARNWQRFGSEVLIPYIAHELLQQWGRLRVVREHVNLVVREYNNIILLLTVEERRLFDDIIRKLDRKINPGLKQLSWMSKHIVEFYVKDTVSHCRNCCDTVKRFHADKDLVNKTITAIANMSLIEISTQDSLEPAVLYEQHKQLMKRRIQELDHHARTINKTVNDNMWPLFRESHGEVQREWGKFVEYINQSMEEALQRCVKGSLQQFSRAVNGDKKSEPLPIFLINLQLEGLQVSYKPPVLDLSKVVKEICKNFLNTISTVRRLKIQKPPKPQPQNAGNAVGNAGNAGGDKANEGDGAESPDDGENEDEEAENAAIQQQQQQQARPSEGKDVPDSFFPAVLNDEHVLKLTTQIMNGIGNIGQHLEKQKKLWENKYRQLRVADRDKDIYIRKYSKADHPLPAIRADIEKYKQAQDEIQHNEPPSQTNNCVKVDTTLLKSQLVEHATSWISKYTGLVHNIAKEELMRLNETMADNSTVLTSKPNNLDELGTKLELHNRLVEEVPVIEMNFEPLRARYKLLADFDERISDKEGELLDHLDEHWSEFKGTLSLTEHSLEKHKVAMRKQLEESVHSLYREIRDSREDLVLQMPFDSVVGLEEAKKRIQHLEEVTTDLSKNQTDLNRGLAFFTAPAMESEELQQTIVDLNNLKAIWTTVEEWDTLWTNWRRLPFYSLDVSTMETSAGQFNKRLLKLGREIKHWQVWRSCKDKIEHFRQVMPLLQDLSNSALRQRHWNQLQEEMGQEFEHMTDSFTLDKVFSMGFYNYADFIANLSASANRELAVENSLESIEERWASVDIDMTVHKQKYFKIKTTDDLFQFLEDDQVRLSTLKRSPFAAAFRTKVEYWERSLRAIMDVVEGLLSVQKQWIYLENIFSASDDIRRQLPSESVIFTEVTGTYHRLSEAMYVDPNAVRACTKEGQLTDIKMMDNKLGEIQKALENYLEVKRMLFPRFYFLSNDDLLEILGQQKDPGQVQKHIKKCFEGIKFLDLVEKEIVDDGQRETLIKVAQGMISPEGEVVPFARAVAVEGPVENWLRQVEEEMVNTLRHIFPQCLQAYRGKKEAWIQQFPGQLLISCGQTIWTSECVKALNTASASGGGGGRSALKGVRRKWVGYINRLTDMTRSDLSKIMRKKVVALITLELHARDVIERMMKASCRSTNDFEWQMQLRYYYVAISDATARLAAVDPNSEDDVGICEVRQTTSALEYSYEYQGNNGRLVITPLTDRCVLTMTTALSLFRGGNPLGPAGTGKTETVKDLGKNLAKFVVVFNCSDGLDYKSVGRMFSGLVQSGGWGCFDEFNRIEIEVLSVVAQQMLSIMTSLASGARSFNFEGRMIRCNPNCGIFITMNPGYAGRTELPDNLKALMRPCAMMVPDLSLISEVMLQSEGYREARTLARKCATLYSLMMQQLSKQDHYDFGLRSVKAVLTMAGSLKRDDPEMPEEVHFLRALRDMNRPKFVLEDLNLFDNLLSDLFPALEIPAAQLGKLQQSIEAELQHKGLQVHQVIVTKTLQLHASQERRHCNMLVGHTLSGKSTVWKTLAGAKNRLCAGSRTDGGSVHSHMDDPTKSEMGGNSGGDASVKGDVQGDEHFVPLRYKILNPKSITLDEIYGVYDLSTFEWRDGILSSIFRDFAVEDRDEERWIVLDGPVDTLWIESMNSVMDDNKVLTLINGDRIVMTNQMALLFEVQDLSVASPATVSRAGMVYMDASGLGYEPYIVSWLAKAFADPDDAKDYEIFRGLFSKYVERILHYKTSQKLKEAFPVTDVAAVRSLCNLLDALIINGLGLGDVGGGGGIKAGGGAGEGGSGGVSTGIGNSNDNSRPGSNGRSYGRGKLWRKLLGGEEGERLNGEAYVDCAERWFVFCCAWSLLSGLGVKGRKTLDIFVRELEHGVFPPHATIFDFYVEPASGNFKLWEEKVNSTWKPAVGMPFHKIFVPTSDTVRYGYLVRRLAQNTTHLALVGKTGVGKTALIANQLESISGTHSKLGLNMSSATTSAQTQLIIENSLEKRSMNRFGPTGGKQLAVFVDDMNMPTKDEFGSMPPLELLRQWLDYKCWYDRSKCTVKYIEDIQLLAAMGPPGGGRSAITPRLLSRFHVINYCEPSGKMLQRIFELMLNSKLSMYDDEVKHAVTGVVQATISFYDTVTETFLPTPSKSHYLFNIRDISRVVQGLLMSDKVHMRTRDDLLRMWMHECLRVFGDRLVDMADMLILRKKLDSRLGLDFQTKWDLLVLDLPEDEREIGPLYACLLAGDPEEEDVPYTEIGPSQRAELRPKLEEYLDEFNSDPRSVNMDLVLFRDATHHLLRILRILKQQRGNAMLVGVGGSGRSSLTRLAAFVAGFTVFSVEVTKNYRLTDFREDIKKLYTSAGVEGKNMVFLIGDKHIKEETFLEDINNILSNGEVPTIFEQDEMNAILEKIRPLAVDSGAVDPDSPADAFWAWFISTVRDRLHVVLCLSPIGDSFRNRVRQFPGLVSCTTIDWFHAWPEDALREVATKYLTSEESLSQEQRQSISEVFSDMHQSVRDASDRMLAEAKRSNYVTPTNFLELVRGYLDVVSKKRSEICDSRDKLRNGLNKLDESRHAVEIMSERLNEQKEIVARKEKDCNELLVVIVGERRVVDEKEKEVRADSERIAKEETEMARIKEEAEQDLAEAMPALERALDEVNKLDSGSIAEVKAYNNPPQQIMDVMAAVMVLFNEKPDWATAKRKLGESNFLRQIKEYDKDNLKDSQLRQIRKYTKRKDFTVEAVAQISRAGSVLAGWVIAMEVYAMVYRQVAPKKQVLKAATASLAEKQTLLQDAKNRLSEIQSKVKDLESQYDNSNDERNKLREQMEDLEKKLERAQQLVLGLSGEKERWEGSITNFEMALTHVTGDSLISAAFISYSGPFTTGYRNELMDRKWMTAVLGRGIKVSSDFEFTSFIAKPTDVREWNLQGLPKDRFSTENGIIATKGRRWPLLIDPQGQGNKWIKNMEKDNLTTIDPNIRGGFMRPIEASINLGNAVLMEDVSEELDPSLEPILAKSIIRHGNKMLIRLGDKELDYHPEFRMYLTTKMANPHFMPEVSTKVTIVNFVVKEQGLEEQLLGIVVQNEAPKLEDRKNELLVRMADEKRKLVELEDQILRLLSEAKGSLLDDSVLVSTLNDSKATSEAVAHQLKVTEDTERKIDHERAAYRPVSLRAGALFFVLNDMAKVDPMYEFSLDAYVRLFKQSMIKSKGFIGAGGNAGGGTGNQGAVVTAAILDELSLRIDEINGYHTQCLYEYACRGLFERHKPLFAFHLCVKVLETEGKIDPHEYSLFLYSGQGLKREDQRTNPAPSWVTTEMWDSLCDLEKLPSGAFQGFCTVFEQHTREWLVWYQNPMPESEPLPGRWEGKCTEMQRLLVVRCLRPDRILFMIQRFIGSALGDFYTQPPQLNLKDAVESSTAQTPLMFVLSPGVDPTKELMGLAEETGVRLYTCALGQGQARAAEGMLQRARDSGEWLFLANCHLMLSWMPALERHIEALNSTIPRVSHTKRRQRRRSKVGPVAPHPNFRLWLSAAPTPKFPISILQASIKMTTEPPRGIRSNMLRLYSTVNGEAVDTNAAGIKYRKLLYCLAWFHSLLLERRKFRTLGWNVVYDFNEADFSISNDVLDMYLDRYHEETPWDALRYLIGEVNYGGRVTDDWDRRLVNTYMTAYLREEVLEHDNYPLAISQEYAMPDDDEFEVYLQHIRGLPTDDPPEVFGQHGNAQIASHMGDTRDLLQTLITLQPVGAPAIGDSSSAAATSSSASTDGGAGSGGGGVSSGSSGDYVLTVARGLKQVLPQPFDIDEIKSMMMDPNSGAGADPEALRTVVLQEMHRYYALLVSLVKWLEDLEKGVKGLVVITPELEQVQESLTRGAVPAQWSFCFLSLKPLGAWAREVLQRVKHMEGWVAQGAPKVFWLGAFTFPTGFLTALLQTTARRHGIPIDSLQWDFTVLQQDEDSIRTAPKDGAYVKGLILEGARWDEGVGTLMDPRPMELHCNMPLVHFRPVEAGRKRPKGVYSCPLYIYPLRTGSRERPSFVIAVDLRSSYIAPENWIKRGTALLLALDH